MSYETTFNHGLRLEMPDGTKRLLPACDWQGDPKYVISGRTLLKSFPPNSEPVESEGLPVGTVVRLWDEDAGHPVLGVIS